MGKPRPFERGAGPLVSVLLPTRGRPEGLCRAVDSLFSLAHDQSNVEVLLKVDDDDLPTQDVAAKMFALLPGNISVTVSPRGKGYLEIHEWINDLATRARGDWLMLFNDDARVRTQGWDRVLLSANRGDIWHGGSDVCVLTAATKGRLLSSEFVIMRRKMVEILGHFSPNPHADNWAFTVGKFLGCAFHAPIEVEHDQDGKDKTFGESDDIRKKTAGEFNSVGNARLRVRDAMVLIDYIEARQGESNA